MRKAVVVDALCRRTASAHCITGRRDTSPWTAYSSYKSWLGKAQEPGPSGKAGGGHFANFADAVRSHDRTKLNAEIEEGAASTILVHLANISYRVGRTINFDPATLTITGDAEAAKMMTRPYRKGFVVPEKV